MSISLKDIERIEFTVMYKLAFSETVKITMTKPAIHMHVDGLPDSAFVLKDFIPDNDIVAIFMKPLTEKKVTPIKIDDECIIRSASGIILCLDKYIRRPVSVINHCIDIDPKYEMVFGWDDRNTTSIKYHLFPSNVSSTETGLYFSNIIVSKPYMDHFISEKDIVFCLFREYSGEKTFKAYPLDIFFTPIGIDKYSMGLFFSHDTIKECGSKCME